MILAYFVVVGVIVFVLFLLLRSQEERCKTHDWQEAGQVAVCQNCGKEAPILNGDT